jgi:hypothetical protein
MKAMKSHSNYLWLFLLLPLFVACDNFDDDYNGYSNYNYRIDIATVQNPTLTSTFSFLLDNNKLYQVTQSNDPTFIPADGQRIIANYTVLSVTKVDSTYTRKARLNDASVVLTKNIFKITPATQDSIGHDSITIKDMWIGNDYLNIEFAYFGNNKTHFINLVSDASKTYTDGKTHLEFRHKGNGDLPTYYSRGIVSFKLKSLQTGASGNVLNLAIHVKVPYQTTEKMYDIPYYFGSTATLYGASDYNTLMKGVHNVH